MGRVSIQLKWMMSKRVTDTSSTTAYAWDHAATPYRGSVVGITNETHWYGGAKYPEQHRLELQLVRPSGEVIDAVRKWYPAYADTRMMVLDAALSFDIPIWDQTWTMNDGRMFNTMIDASAPIRMRIELRSIDDLLGIKHFYLSTSTTATVTSLGRGIAGIYGPRDRMEDEEKEKRLHAQDRGYLLGLLEVVQGMARTRGKMRADEQGSTMPTGPC
jgi:hypothetical protein